MAESTARPWRLFGFPNRALDAALTLLAAALLAWSRFAWLADGPWEWDETLFARGILHFELAAHFPHPPGFPGWLALGHLLTPLTADPLRALQIASAGFSVAALWVLAALGRRVAPAPVAALAALMALAAPGPWLYAVRGFSSTAASVLALAAAALLAGGLGGRRVTAFTGLVTASFLVRPILLPALAVLWLGGAATVRPWRRLLPGVAAGVAAVAAAAAAMARAEGGWGPFVAAFAAHSSRHFSRLVDNPGGIADLGLIKGLGGVLPAAVLLALVALGLARWWCRVGRRAALLWLAVLVVASAQLVLLQNRTYGRYAVGVQMALAPLVAGAAATLSPPLAAAGLAGATAWYAASSAPLLAEQHRSTLPAWRAVEAARERALAGGSTVVVEPELHPFASYLWHLQARRGEANPPLVLSPWAPEPWAGVTGPWLVATVHRHLYPEPLFGFEESYAGVSPALRPLTQQRFLEAWVIDEAPLPLADWWPAETTPEGRSFMWAAGDAELLLPPLSAGAELHLALRAARGAEPAMVLWNGSDRAILDGESGDEHLRLAPPPLPGAVTRLEIRRAAVGPAGAGDPRRLAVQLFGIRAVDPLRAWTLSPADPWDREVLGPNLEGAYGSEAFAGGLSGVWLRPTAALTLPAEAGTLSLELSAPRPTPPHTELWLDGVRAAGPLELGPTPAAVALRLGAAVAGAPRRLVIRSGVYRPSEQGSEDPRTLGVVLHRVSYAPALRHLDAPAGGP